MGINTIACSVATNANQFLEAQNHSTNDSLGETAAVPKSPLSVRNEIIINGNNNNNNNNNNNYKDNSNKHNNDINNTEKLLNLLDKRDIDENDGGGGGSDVDEDFEDAEDINDGSTSQTIIKCSAVHTLDRDMPNFDYTHLVDELRVKILNECQSNEGIYSKKDIEKCQNDDWHIRRFLLRQKLDVDAAFEMLKKTMRFHNESLFSYIRPEDFPSEFYNVAGLFGYEPDRKGNKMLYIRAKVHRKIPEIQAVLQTFLYYNIHSCDQQVGGKGMCIVFDCSGAGLASADMEMLFFILTILMNYFPKGLSYILVHELPWILKPIWLIARAWIPEEHRDMIKFSNSRTIYEYVDKENLPDFMGGTCEIDYRKAPENCTTLREASKLYGIEPEVVKRVLKKFAEYLPPQYVEKLDEELGKPLEDEKLELKFADRS